MTTEALTDQAEKIDAYLNIVEDRILASIERTEIKKYCSATLLILFAAIDGLGKLGHRSKKAGVGDRIRWFLGYMGGDYALAENKEALYDLRNSLAHNAVNLEFYLSHDEINCNHHLKTIGANDFLFVDTIQFYDDVKQAFNRLRSELKDNSEMMEEAGGRLVWTTIQDDLLDDLEPQPSPQAPVKYVRTRP